MTDTEIKECQEWLDKLKLDDIPKGYKWQRSLMDITGIKHHENMWSDIYKFFFDIKESHNLGDLFIRSLESILIKESIIRKPHFLGNRFLIDREFDVKGKRIDLLLCDDMNNRAIIIENKVKHSLDNDLNLYYREVCSKGYSDAIVIVIGLHKYDLNQKAKEIPDNRKSSITHYQFIDEVISKLPEYYKQSNPKYLYLLQEFAKNITNMTNNMKEDIEFYFRDDNRIKINKLSDIRTRVINHISNSLEDKDIVLPLFKKYDLKLEIGKNKDNIIYYNFNKDCKDCKEKIKIKLEYHSLWDFKDKGCRIKAELEFNDEMKNWVQKHKDEFEGEFGKDICFTPAELKSDFQEKLCKELKPLYEKGFYLVEQYNLKK